ncbi:MAG TPA: hypothetical protein VM536_00340, partial [Chloroflexia bacterium]|nr:hypothetical protein [Chloroflexia bacterium]
SRLYLLDLDLYCQGDPGLDVGNFLAHLAEQSLRTLGDSTALADREARLGDAFLALAGERVRPALQTYRTLTLVRHIALSTQLPGRQAFTGALLDLCEQELGIAARPLYQGMHIAAG